LAWIYAFRDARYEKGIKIGWEKSSKGNKYIDIAQSYSPAEIVYEAAWEIFEEVKGRSGSNKIEERACEGLLSLTYPNNGKEWLDVDVEKCLSKVSTNLKTKPIKIILGKYSNYDDFRSPKTIDDPRMTKFKQVLWVYEEHLSGRVKVQRIDDWQTPREQRKRYSRNGFCPVAAFTYEGRITLQKNLAIHDNWKAVLEKFNTPTDNSTYGWLPCCVSAKDVTSFLSNTDFVALTPPFSNKPDGVRTSYNKAE
jgi:hypothetical protein